MICGIDGEGNGIVCVKEPALERATANCFYRLPMV